jgi:hypothetical protein
MPNKRMTVKEERADGVTVYMVEQYRYPVGSRFWELPQGQTAALPGKSIRQDLRIIEIVCLFGTPADSQAQIILAR